MATATAAMAVLWLGLLPQVGRWPAVRAHIERNEALGIDPSAKFYTETLLPTLADKSGTTAIGGDRPRAPAP